MKKFLLTLSLLTIISAGCQKQSPALSPVTENMQSPYNKIIQIGSRTLNVQVVTAAADMQRGLSGREQIANDQGMLFDFGAGANVTPGFWMKDMKFDLDIIWINNNKIVSITSDVSRPAPGTPDKQLTIYYPSSPVDQVLEVNAGWTKQNNVTVGDAVVLK